MKTINPKTINPVSRPVNKLIKTKHLLDKRLAPRHIPQGLAPTRIALVGAGGSGSQMVTCLARTDRALRALGLPPLAVTLYDPDRVSPANVGRQLFYPDDVGQSKAIVLIHRANMGFGLDWQAVPALYAPKGWAKMDADGNVPCDILVTCVDTGAARWDIWETLSARADAPRYWLDIANEDETGQVWLGQFPRFSVGDLRNGDLKDKGTDGQSRLPCITEAFPEFFDEGRGDYVPETNNPSCSLAEALKTQDLFVNDHCTRWGAQILWTLLRYGEIAYHGAWINLRDGSAVSVPVTISDPAALPQEDA